MKKKQKFNKSLSYLMLPLMAAFTFGPNISFASVVYMAGANNRGVPQSAFRNDSASFKKLNNALKAAKALNNKNNKNGQNASKKSSPASSNASNYTMGIGAEVNPQTGQLSLNFNNAQLAGITKDVNIDFGLSNSGATQQVYNLPAGWKFNLDYIDTSDTIGGTGTDHRDGKLHLNSSKNYDIVLDSSQFTSGLKYERSKAIKLVEDQGSLPLKHPYTNYKGYKVNTLYYNYKLESVSGAFEYFDNDGKLICKADRFGNQVVYAYKPAPGVPEYAELSVYNSQLSSVIDSYGQKISVNIQCGNIVTITMPDNSFIKYTFESATGPDSPKTVVVRGLTGRTSKILYNNNQVKEIDFPTGGCTKFTWGGKIPYLVDNTTGALQYFPAVSKVITSQAKYSGDSYPSNAMVKTYDYNPNNDNHSFAGPDVYVPNHDQLMQSDNNLGYQYATEVTQKTTDNKYIHTIITYNHLHLPVTKRVFYNGSSSNSACQNDLPYSETKITYLGSGLRFKDLPANYTLPSNTTTTIYNVNSNAANSAKSVTYQVNTKYNDYGQPTQVVNLKSYTGNTSSNNTPEAITTTNITYFNTNNDESKTFGQVETKSVTDNKNSTTITTTNTLSGNSKYVAKTIMQKSDNSGVNEIYDPKITEYQADSMGRTISQTLEYQNKQASNSLNGVSGPTSSNSQTSYSITGNLLTVTSTDAQGHSSTKVINTSNGRVMSETDPMGHTESFEYGENGLTVTKVLPDGSKVITSNTNPNKSVTIFSTGRVVTKYLDGLGRVTKETDSFYPANNHVVMTRTYNRLGKVATQTDALGHPATKYQYNDWQERLTNKTDFLGNTESMVFNDTANVSNSPNIRSIATIYSNGLKVSETDYDQNGKKLGSEDFTASNNQLPDDSWSNGASSDLVNITKADYNGFGEKISSTLEQLDLNSNSASGANSLMGTKTKYDSYGQAAQVDLYAKNSAGNYTKIGSSTFSRNLFGQITQRITDFTNLPAHVVPNNTSNSQNQLNSESKSYNNLGKLITLTDPAKKYNITYKYNADGQVSSMSDFAGHSFTYQYNDPFGRKTSMSGPGVQETYSYWVANGKAPENEQLKSETLTTTDQAGNKETRTLSFDYNQYGQLSTETYPDGKQMLVNYNKAGLVSSITDFAGVKTTFNYDYNNSTSPVITSVSNEFGSVNYSYCNRANGPLFGSGTTMKEAKYSNGINVIYQYYNEILDGTNNASGNSKKAPQLMSITTTQNGNVINETKYGYDNQGRTVEIVETSPANPNNYTWNNEKHITYNSMGEVISTETDGIKPSGNSFVETNAGLRGTENYYDLNGNLVKTEIVSPTDSHTVEYTFDKDDRLSGYSNTDQPGKNFTFINSANGNLLNDTKGNDCTYNSLNQLVTFKCNDQSSPFYGHTFHYSYLPDGLRWEKWEDNDKADGIYYYYNSGSQIINERQDSTMSAYLMSGSDRIARCLSSGSQSNGNVTFTPEDASFYIKNAKDVIGITNDKSENSNSEKGKTDMYQYTSYGTPVNYGSHS